MWQTVASAFIYPDSSIEILFSKKNAFDLIVKFCIFMNALYYSNILSITNRKINEVQLINRFNENPILFCGRRTQNRNCGKAENKAKSQSIHKNIYMKLYTCFGLHATSYILALLCVCVMPTSIHLNVAHKFVFINHTK